MSEEYEDKINNGENDTVEVDDTVSNQTENEPVYSSEVQDTVQEDGQKEYTEEAETFNNDVIDNDTSNSPNDYRSTDSYNGYSNNNGYTNNDTSYSEYSVSSYTGQSKAEEKVIKSIDKRAAQAAKKAARQQKKAEQQQKKALNKENKGGFFGRAIRFVFAALIFGVIAGGAMIGTGYGYDYFMGNSNKRISKTQTSTRVNAEVTEEKETENVRVSEQNTDKTVSNGKAVITDVSEIVGEVMPSVVAITSTEIVQSAGNDFWSYFYGGGNSSGEQYESQGAGSGIIVGESDTELLIVTNQHVVSDADKLSVQFVNGESVEASVRGENEKQDIAVISIPLKDIDKETIDSIKIATLGDSDKVRVGEGSIAIGNALGYGQSVTTGVISALDRTITVDNYERTVIQTDAAISPGNSGGALLNMNGEVIGINCAKSIQDYSEGIGYTIPITLVKDLIDDMMTKEVKNKVSDSEKGYLNIRGKDVTQELSQMYDIPEGVYIMEVIKGGAADKAGLSKYDVITELEGETVSSMVELKSALEYYKKGEKVKLTIETIEGNEYSEKEVEIELGGEME
ncbi:MAG: trypsin-like peptidase domain-containing protein [Lachnospiraceae bacterium]|nr:trypsin-like peptidase domain-containing protein [Lachnospiraceae bacterium]MDE6251925.1 trypsin-like peptidase domain-containing protein [Lachnospiraceae bacterium]